MRAAGKPRDRMKKDGDPLDLKLFCVRESE